MATPANAPESDDRRDFGLSAEQAGSMPTQIRSPNQRATPPVYRINHLASRIHALGPRPLAELLNEVAAGRDLFERLEVYAALPADVIKAFGGDVLPALRALDGGWR